MSIPQMVMYEEEFRQIQAIADRLVRESNSQSVFIIDKNGQEIAVGGDAEQVDTTGLASLIAANIAATGGIAKLLGEKSFTTQFYEGEARNTYIVSDRVILTVVYDNKTSLGLVRLRVRAASKELDTIFEQLLNRMAMPGQETPFAEITDDDIDNLFND